jgi:hypothetical protein
VGKENQWVTGINKVQIPAGSDPMANLMLQGEAGEDIRQAIGDWLERLT